MIHYKTIESYKYLISDSLIEFILQIELILYFHINN